MPNTFPDPFQKSADDQQITAFDKRRRAADMVRRFMRRSEEYRRPYLDRGDQAAEVYECWLSVSKSQINRANLRLPYAYLIVETETPTIASKFLNFKPPFKLKGRNAVDMQWEDKLTDFYAMQFEQMRFPSKLVPFLKSASIRGTSVAKIPYKYKEQVVSKRTTTIDPMYGIPITQKTKTLDVVYDGPDFEFIPLVDFFPDWTVRTPADIESMRGVVHRTWKTMSELRGGEKRTEADGSKVGVYEKLDELDISIQRKGIDAWGDPYYKSDFANRATDKDVDIKKKPIELWEYWGLFDVNDNGQFVEYIITVANGDVVVRCQENFYDYKLKPFAAAVNVPLEGEFYGASELFAIKGSIKEATALRNARLDQINLAVNRQWIVDRAAGINARALYSRPNGIIWANDIRGITPLPPPEVPASAFREVQELGSEIQTTAASSSGPSLQEAGKVFGRSATGASMVSNISNSRSGLKAKYIAETFMRSMVRIIMMTNAQFVTDQQWVRSNDPNTQNPFTALPSEAFHTDYDFEIVAGFDADPADDLQRLQTAMPIFQTAEQSQPGVIKWDVFFQQFGRDLFGREVKKFTRTPEEMAQMQAQGMAAQQAGNQQIGAQAPQPNAALGPAMPQRGGKQ